VVTVIGWPLTGDLGCESTRPQHGAVPEGGSVVRRFEGDMEGGGGGGAPFPVRGTPRPSRATVFLGCAGVEVEDLVCASLRPALTWRSPHPSGGRTPTSAPTKPLEGRLPGVAHFDPTPRVRSMEVGSRSGSQAGGPWI